MARRIATGNLDAPTGDAGTAARLDLWLWAARFFRTRALARQAIDAGRVDVNEAAGKQARLVHAGDRLCISRGEDRYEVDVVATSRTRGPAAAAQRLYRETDAGRAARETAAEQRRLAVAGYARPPKKPDKRARRLIRALGDIDAL